MTNTPHPTESDALPERPLPRRSLIIGVGVASGAVGGLLGGGGGVVTVPALDRLTSLTRATVHGTSTVANVAVAVVGAAVYALRGGAVDLKTGLGLMVGGVVGALLGARFAAGASDRVLRLIFITVLLVAGVKLLLSAADAAPVTTAALLPASVRDNLVILVPIAVAVGLVTGSWSAAMGLGGGLLTVPALVILFGVNQHIAEGTSLLVMLPNTVTGSIAHVRQGTALPRLGATLGLGSGVGASVGALLALALNGHVLGIIFGAFTLIMALREAIRMYHRYRATPL